MSTARILEMLAEAVGSKQLMGAAVQVTRKGEPEDPILVGQRRLDDESMRVERNTIFLVASITKPIVCAAVMKLVEDGLAILDDPVTKYVPEFGAKGKEGVLVRHLLTHTSGLPDQIPENRAYREVKRPLSDFVIRICELPLAFAPGTQVSYQSSGIAMLGEICERVTGTSLPDYLNETIFDPIGLQDTSLGIQSRDLRESDVVMAGEGLTHGGSGTGFDWNSDYWRGFGAPWGGMLTTIEEMTRLMLLFRNGGGVGDKRVLSESSVSTMLEDHVTRMPGMTSEGQKGQRWGLGWRLSGPQVDVFGDLVSDYTFGHGGATGTLAWCDPVKDVICVIFTNDPDAAKRLQGRISNAVMTST